MGEQDQITRCAPPYSIQAFANHQYWNFEAGEAPIHVQARRRVVITDFMSMMMERGSGAVYPRNERLSVGWSESLVIKRIRVDLRATLAFSRSMVRAHPWQQSLTPRPP